MHRRWIQKINVQKADGVRYVELCYTKGWLDYLLFPLRPPVLLILCFWGNAKGEWDSIAVDFASDYQINAGESFVRLEKQYPEAYYFLARQFLEKSLQGKQ